MFTIKGFTEFANENVQGMVEKAWLNNDLTQGTANIIQEIPEGEREITIPAVHSLCRDSLLYKGSEDDDEELELEVTGWAWNKRTKTRTMMTATRVRVKGSMIAVRLRLWGVDKRTV